MYWVYIVHTNATIPLTENKSAGLNDEAILDEMDIGK